MKKILLIMVLLVFNSTSVYAGSEKFNEALALTIRANDYRCDYVNKSFRPRQTARGTEIKVQCDGGNYLYKVIITPSERFIVEMR